MYKPEAKKAASVLNNDEVESGYNNYEKPQSK